MTRCEPKIKARSLAKKAGSTKHAELIAGVDLAVRKMNAQSALTSRIVADRFCLYMTDVEALDLILSRGELSAGELAEATGLTSGAVTGLIDRLAKAGYIERSDHPSDRRKVLVRIQHDAVEPIKSFYMGMQKKMFSQWSMFDTRDLEVVTHFLSLSTEIAVACCNEISQDAPPSSARRRSPRAGRRGMVLFFTREEEVKAKKC